MKRHARGFTLVEVMVALLVMAVMAALAWQGVDGISRSRTVSQAHMESTLRVNTVLAQWTQDLQKVYNTPSVPPLTFDGATLRVVRYSDSGAQVVAWSLRGNALMRWSGPVVTRQEELQNSWLNSQQLLGNEPNQLRALEGVDSLQVYFYRRNGWSNAQSSGDIVEPATPAPPVPPASGASAPPVEVAPQVELPSGVRLVMAFNGSMPGLSGSLTRDVALGPQPP